MVSAASSTPTWSRLRSVARSPPTSASWATRGSPSRRCSTAKRRTGERETTEWAEHTLDLRRRLRRKTDFDDVPIKPQRVFQEINDFFDADTVFVTAIGLYQIWSGQFQEIYKPRHYLICGQAGPLGWEVPACLGAKIARPDQTVVGIVGDYSFEFLMEEVAVACQYSVPYVLVMINNAYMGLISRRRPSSR